jgi:hypothetical protein
MRSPAWWPCTSGANPAPALLRDSYFARVRLASATVMAVAGGVNGRACSGDMPFSLWRSSAWRHADGSAPADRTPAAFPRARHGAVSLPAHAIQPHGGSSARAAC